ncbi:MAG: FtsX-like permease family protein [Bacteroidales bacterium]
MRRIIKEAVNFTIYSFRRDKFRTILSLSAVMIGIFSIVTILSAVDTMKRSVNKGLNSFGVSTVYVQKIPWNNIQNIKIEDIIKRPIVSYADFKYLNKNLICAKDIVYTSIFNPKIIYNSSIYQGSTVFASTRGIDDFLDIKYAYGRAINSYEYKTGSSVVVLGDKIAKSLLEEDLLVGKTTSTGSSSFFPGKYNIRINNEKVSVVGIIKGKGESITSIVDVDRTLIIPYKYGKKVFPIKKKSGMIMVKPLTQENTKVGSAVCSVSDEEFISQIKLMMRQKRLLNPIQEDNFSINQMSILLDKLSNIFKKINLAGWIIAAFSLIIGGFGIANIMFVSVSERRQQIGVQKAIGAKSKDIMIQYLVESAIISVLGGIFAISLVYLLSFLITWVSDFPFTVSLVNILTGLIVSFIIGILSGIVPARYACRLDPIIAMA